MVNRYLVIHFPYNIPFDFIAGVYIYQLVVRARQVSRWIELHVRNEQ